MKLTIAEMLAAPPPAKRKSLIRRATSEIIIYSIYLLTSLLLAIATRDDTMYDMHEVITKHFVRRSIVSAHEQTNTYCDIATEEEWWSYVEKVILNSLHVDGKIVEENKFILEENLLLGPPRLRQKRVRPNTCEIHDHFSTMFKDCYGQFTTANEETAEDYKGTKYLQPTNFDVLHMGMFSELNDGGYVQDLTFNEQKNKEIFNKLKEAGWLDRATRLVVLEFSCFNYNTHLFDNFKLAAETPSIGGVLPEVHNEIINMHTFWTKPDNYWVWVTCGIFYCCLAFFIYEEIYELFHTGRKYFESFWNYFDLCIIILCLYCAGYQFWHASMVDRLATRFIENPDKFLNIDELAYKYSTYLSVYSFCVFLQCIRLFKYFSLYTTLLQFIITMKRCAKDLFGLFFMFGVLFLAYALVGMLMFCSYHKEFRDVKSSFLSTIKMIVGKMDYDNVEENSHVVAPIYFVSYIIVVFFVFMNMFLAILADTYLKVKQEIRSGELDLSSFLMSSFKGWLKKVRTRCQKLKRKFCKKKKPDLDADNKRMTESEILRTYFEIIGPYNNIDYKAQHIHNFDNKIHRLQKRLTIVELAMEELSSNLDIIFKHGVLNRKPHNYTYTSD